MPLVSFFIDLYRIVYIYFGMDTHTLEAVLKRERDSCSEPCCSSYSLSITCNQALNNTNETKQPNCNTSSSSLNWSNIAILVSLHLTVTM